MVLIRRLPRLPRLDRPECGRLPLGRTVSFQTLTVFCFAAKLGRVSHLFLTRQPALTSPSLPSSIMSGLAHTPSHPNHLQAPATASHPPTHKPDPTLGHAERGLSTSPTARCVQLRCLDARNPTDFLASATEQPGTMNELATLKRRLKSSLRQFPDFPSPGILFEDILPIFADPALHESLLRALQLHISQTHEKPDVIVGLEARGFLFGPSLALRLGAGFVPVRKKGKLPGPCETASYEKEYGQDFFQMQADGVKQGQKVLIVDDIIATGKSHRSQIVNA